MPEIRCALRLNAGRVFFAALLFAAPLMAQEDEYTPIEAISIEPGRVTVQTTQGVVSAGGCINAAFIISSKWQWRRTENDPWEDIPGSQETGKICAMDPESPGEYRLVGEFQTGDDEIGKYSSFNTIIVEGEDLETNSAINTWGKIKRAVIAD